MRTSRECTAKAIELDGRALLVPAGPMRDGLMKTKGRRRAIVAVARKIAVVLHRMWADGTEFRLGSEAAA